MFMKKENVIWDELFSELVDVSYPFFLANVEFV